MSKQLFTFFAPAALAALLLAGCAKEPVAPAAEATAVEPASDETGGHGLHGGWWCGEHGVPEGVCALCDSDLAANFQKQGDWCTDHDRPDSQCFQCHPELEAKFAAQYQAKYGKKPPKPEG